MLRLNGSVSASTGERERSARNGCEADAQRQCETTAHVAMRSPDSAQLLMCGTHDTRLEPEPLVVARDPDGLALEYVKSQLNEYCHGVGFASKELMASWNALRR